MFLIALERKEIDKVSLAAIRHARKLALDRIRAAMLRRLQEQRVAEGGGARRRAVAARARDRRRDLHPGPHRSARDRRGAHVRAVRARLRGAGPGARRAGLDPQRPLTVVSATDMGVSPRRKAKAKRAGGGPRGRARPRRDPGAAARERPEAARRARSARGDEPRDRKRGRRRRGNLLPALPRQGRAVPRARVRGGRRAREAARDRRAPAARAPARSRRAPAPR